MKDYQIAQQIYESLWDFEYSPFQILIGSTKITITPTEKRRR